MKLVALVLCVASLALVAAGCGGDDSSEASAAAEWADEFCTITREWGDELQRIGDEVGDLQSLSSDAIREAGEEADAATDAYVEDVRALGRPETESGQEVEDSLETLADEIEAESAEIEDAIEDASGITGIATTAREISTSLVAMFTALEQALEALEAADVDGELETALGESDACDDLVN